MARIVKTAAVAAIIWSGLATAAGAHTGLGATMGFGHGFGHPIGGLDHVLAMVAVGLFAAHLGRRALWLVPSSFVAMMAVGGALGMSGVDVPMVEMGIAASVVVLGVLVALQARLPTAAAMGLVGFFAIFHGHAHGAEMPADAGGLSYALGFMLATALLHAAGIALGLGIAGAAPVHSNRIVKAAGAVMAALGVGILGGYA
jgi:urease accessory protein